jgi:hypothetical protein
MFSVHRAYFIKPDTCEFFFAAARILLELGPGKFPGASRGYAFGWTLGKIVNDLRVREFHRGRKKPPHRRFPFSNPSIMPNLERPHFIDHVSHDTAETAGILYAKLRQKCVLHFHISEDNPYLRRVESWF